MNQIINILCATDNNYAPYCGILLTSLFMNNKAVKFCVYIMIDSAISDKNQGKFAQLSNQYGHKIQYIHVDKTIFDKYPTTDPHQWVTNVYYRLLAADLLPHDVHKVLYLDCDMVVTSSIKELWDTPLDGYALAGAFDPGTHCAEFYQRLELSQDSDYINGGMLLLNLDYWRMNNISQQCLDYLSANHSKLYCNDQDIVNAVLQGQRITVSSTYNYMTFSLRVGVFNSFPEERKQEILSIKNPIIIHYADSEKPWQITYAKKPFHREWNFYKSCSNWKYQMPILPNGNVFNKLIKNFILEPLGLVNTFIKLK